MVFCGVREPNQTYYTQQSLCVDNNGVCSLCVGICYAASVFPQTHGVTGRERQIGLLHSHSCSWTGALCLLWSHSSPHINSLRMCFFKAMQYCYCQVVIHRSSSKTLLLLPRKLSRTKSQLWDIRQVPSSQFSLCCANCQTFVALCCFSSGPQAI